MPVRTPTFSVEVITLPVSDVERALRFYVDQVGFTPDVDYSPTDAFRVVQLTPPGSSCSIQIGNGLTNAPAGSLRSVYLVVTDLEAARSHLLERGVEVGEIRHKTPIGAWDGSFAPGLDPARGDYASFANFSDPDGNNWVLRNGATAMCDVVWERAAFIDQAANLQHHTSRSEVVAMLNRIKSPAWAPVPLRLIVGFGFMQHGYAKLVKGPDAFAYILHGLGVPAPHLMTWLTILTELLGGLAVLLGAFITLVSVPLAVVLLTAIFSVHWRYGFSSIKLLAVTPAGAQFGPPGYECNLLYLACLVALVLLGSGPLSFDGVFSPRLLASSRRT